MHDLIVFSHLRWDFVFQRPQHLLSRLAGHRRVIFIEEPVFAAGDPGWHVSSPCAGVTVLRAHTPVRADGFADEQMVLLEGMVREQLRALDVGEAVAWFYTPMALPLLKALPAQAVIYDCMDELSAFDAAPAQLRTREAELLQVADVVFTGGPSLYEAKKTLHANVHCFPSAVDVVHFAPARTAGDTDETLEAQRLQRAISKPRLGFFGVIDERMDLALIDALARAEPDWQVVMVGPVVKIDPASLPRHANLHWLGQQPYAALPTLVAGWDVCLLPFALNASTRFISPTKTLEYMAAEKPVVSTAVHDVVGLYGEQVRIAADAGEFIAHCRAALHEGTAERAMRIANMRAAVATTSWDRTAEAIRRLVDTAAGDGSSATWTAAEPAQVDHLIVGAGPTGLAAAYYLGLSAPHASTLLIEREQRVGGWCRSIVDGGFTFDHAGHIMFSNDAEVLRLYELLLGENVHWQNREAWVYSQGVHTRYPFQGALYGLPPNVLKECLMGAIEAHAAAKPAGPNENFEEFIFRVWGRGVAKHFAIPYNKKLWAVPLSEMETSWLGGRVPLPNLEQMIDGALEPVPAPMGPNARFGYPLHGGFQSLMDGFLPLVEDNLSLGVDLLALWPQQRLARTSDGRTLHYKKLVSTMPLPQLVAACGEHAPQAVRDAAQGLQHVSVRCVNLGVARAGLTDKHWIYYPEDTVFHRIFVQGNASPNNQPAGGFGLTCEITYSPTKPLPADGQALIDLCIADAKRVGLLQDDDQMLVTNQVDMPCAYVVYDHGRAAHVGVIRDWLAAYDVILAGRYSEWLYYNSDHAFMAGRRAAQECLQASPVSASDAEMSSVA